MSSYDSDLDSEANLKTKLISAIPTKPKGLLQPKPPITGSTPTSWGDISYRSLVLILLPILSLLGLYGTWILADKNGTFESIVTLLEDPDATLPGTDDLLLRKFVGLGWVDHQLSILVTFFAPVLDAGPGREGLALFSVFGLGQFGGVWTLMVMESLREGNKGLVVSFIGTVGFIFQNISFVVTTSLWLTLHLLTSPVSKPFPGANSNSVVLILSRDLLIIPSTITISCLLPSLVMSLPSPQIISPATHQQLIATWQFFPLFTVLTQYALRTSTQYLTTKIWVSDPNSKTSASASTQTRAPQGAGASYLLHARYVYKFVLALCIGTYIPILVLTLLPSFLLPPSITPLLSRLGKQTFTSVFLPYFPSLSHKITSLAEGVHTFLIWDLYIGCLAFLLWAILLHLNATTEKTIVDQRTSSPIYRELLVDEKEKVKRGGGGDADMAARKLAVKVVGWCLVAGPMGAVTVLLWERDEIVMMKIKQGI